MHGTTEGNTEDISEISEIQRGKYCMVSFMLDT